MARGNGKRAHARPKPRKLKYFYLLDAEHGWCLHGHLHTSRANDQITTWNYPLRKRVVSAYSDVKKNHRPAFTMREVCAMLGRGRTQVQMAIVNGNITEPQHMYPLVAGETQYKKYFFSEDNVLEAHAYFSSIHTGRPRKDGKITTVGLPTERELRAMMRQETVLYVQTEDGEFKPVWRAPDWD